MGSMFEPRYTSKELKSYMTRIELDEFKDIMFNACPRKDSENNNNCGCQEKDKLLTFLFRLGVI